MRKARRVKAYRIAVIASKSITRVRETASPNKMRLLTSMLNLPSK